MFPNFGRAFLEAVAQYFHLERDTSESALQSVVDKLLAGDLPAGAGGAEQGGEDDEGALCGIPAGM